VAIKRLNTSTFLPFQNLQPVCATQEIVQTNSEVVLESIPYWQHDLVANNILGPLSKSHNTEHLTIAHPKY